jgi:hypothetical protein
LEYFYASYKDGGLGFNKFEDEYRTYKIHHAATMIKIHDGRRILKGYGRLEQKLFYLNNHVNNQIMESLA